MRRSQVGVYYCTEHHGILNEDSDVCDFVYADPWHRNEDEEGDCTPVALEMVGPIRAVRRWVDMSRSRFRVWKAIRKIERGKRNLEAVS